MSRGTYHSSYYLGNKITANLKRMHIGGVGAGSRNRLMRPKGQLDPGPGNCCMETVVVASAVASQDCKLVTKPSEALSFLSL